MIKIKLLFSDISNYMHTLKLGGWYFPELGVWCFADANIQNIHIIHDYFNMSL